MPPNIFSPHLRVSSITPVVHSDPALVPPDGGGETTLEANAQSVDPAHLDIKRKAHGATTHSSGADVLMESGLSAGHRALESITPTVGPPSEPPTFPPVPTDITSSINSGRWYTFYNVAQSGFVRGCGPNFWRYCPGTPGVTLPTDVITPPWVISSPLCTTIAWTETGTPGSRFELWVNGRHLQTGLAPVSGPDCGDDPATCFAGGFASRGAYYLPPGRQSITFKSATPWIEDRGASRVDSYPCQSGSVNSLDKTGNWLQLKINYLGSAVPNENPGAIPSPWTFYSPCPVEFSIVEQYFSNNRFEVYDNGVLVGRTNVAAVDICQNGYIEPETGCLCLYNVDQCIANGAANGKFILPWETHSITIKGYPSLKDYGVFKIDSKCPLPTQAPTMMPVKTPTAIPFGTAPPYPRPPTDARDVLKEPTIPPTNLPTNRPTNSPTQDPTHSPTKAPTNSSTTRPTTAQFLCVPS
jgi:hypothetical protein